MKTTIGEQMVVLIKEVEQKDKISDKKNNSSMQKLYIRMDTGLRRLKKIRDFEEEITNLNS
jgi:alanine racemase